MARIAHLPPGIVGLLDDLWVGEGDLSASLEAFIKAREAAGGWLQRESTYSLHEADLARLKKLAQVWDEVDALLKEPQTLTVSGLAEPVFQAAFLMDDVQRERNHGHFSVHPPVNQLLMAGAALVEGRGTPEGVVMRLSPAGTFYGEVAGLARLLKTFVDPRLHSDIDRATGLLYQGLQLIEQGVSSQDTSMLRHGMAALQAGSELSEHLLEWERTELERVAAGYRRFNLPLVGPQLEAALPDTSPGHGGWQEFAEAATELHLPRLEAFWEGIVPNLLLPNATREGLLQAVDEAIEELYAALETAHGDSIVATLEQASSAFTLLQSSALRADRSPSPTAVTYEELLRGLLSGSVPLITLSGMLELSPPPGADSVKRALTDYLEEGDPAYLSTAMEEMLAAFPPLEDDEIKVCRYCGERHAEPRLTCQGCGGLML